MADHSDFPSPGSLKSGRETVPLFEAGAGGGAGPGAARKPPARLSALLPRRMEVLAALLLALLLCRQPGTPGSGTALQQ